MPSLLLRIFLIGSAISPTIFIWAIVISAQDNFSNDKRLQFVFIVLLVLSVILVFTPPSIIKWAISKDSIGNCKVILKSIKLLNNSGEGFVGVYLIPFLASAVTNINYLIMLAVLFILCFSMWMNNSYSFNPVLAIWKYRFYEVSNSKNAGLVLLSKRRIADPSIVKTAYKITDNLYLDAEDKNV